MKRLLALSILILTVSVVSALPTEERWNQRTIAVQRDPRIVRDGAGNLLIVFTSSDSNRADGPANIMARRIGPGGQAEEWMVHDNPAGDQRKPAVAMHPSGEGMVVWASLDSVTRGFDIHARRVTSTGPVGPQIDVATIHALTQTNPDVAVTHDGGFVVTWDSWGQDGSDRGVFARIFAADGTPTTDDFPVNSTTANSQARPAVACLADGRLVIVWESWLHDGSGYAVIGRVFTSAGQPATGEFMVNTTMSDNQWFADVAPMPDSSFVVTWCSWGQDGSGGSIVFQRFTPAATKAGGEHIVNSTTVEYQWLPRITALSPDGFAVVWSSWKEDGDREGVFARAYHADGSPASFELPVNTVTSSFQWEPDLAALGPGSVTVVWSGWGQPGGADYDVYARDITFRQPEGYVGTGSTVHSQGRSTARVIAHVMDSLALTGHAYRVAYDSVGIRAGALTVIDQQSGDTTVSAFPIARGENVWYLTPVFDGLAVQFVPEFDLDIDVSHSMMVNKSGTNILFNPTSPTVATKLLAPIDVALIWGVTDTLPGGQYTFPLDTAINTAGNRVVRVPFIAWNLTDNARMELLVSEVKVNQRWDPGEIIAFRTPVAYRQAITNMHAQLQSVVPTGPVVMPAAGDTNYVFTTRPLREGESWAFTATPSAVVSTDPVSTLPADMRLDQNFPNPFNPRTTVRFSLGQRSHVRLEVYSVLGQRVATLLDGVEEAGVHRVRFEGNGLASGMYFYRLESGHKILVGKMLLLR